MLPALTLSQFIPLVPQCISKTLLSLTPWLGIKSNFSTSLPTLQSHFSSLLWIRPHPKALSSLCPKNVSWFSSILAPPGKSPSLPAPFWDRVPQSVPLLLLLPSFVAADDSWWRRLPLQVAVLLENRFSAQVTTESPAEPWNIPTSRSHPGPVKSDHEICGPGIWTFNVPRWLNTRWKISTASSAARFGGGGDKCPCPSPLDHPGAGMQGLGRWDSGLEHPPHKHNHRVCVTTWECLERTAVNNGSEYVLQAIWDVLGWGKASCPAARCDGKAKVVTDRKGLSVPLARLFLKPVLQISLYKPYCL